MIILVDYIPLITRERISHIVMLSYIVKIIFGFGLIET